MLPTYHYNNSETIETVYTYDKWLKEYKRRNARRKIRQNTENFNCMTQRLSGLLMAAVGIVSPFLLGEEASFAFLAVPTGIYLLLTKEKVMTL